MENVKDGARASATAKGMMMIDPVIAPPSLTRYAGLSIVAGIATILLKGVAWHLTGSVGLLSDAIESCVNRAGAVDGTTGA